MRPADQVETGRAAGPAAAGAARAAPPSTTAATSSVSPVRQNAAALFAKISTTG